MGVQKINTTRGAKVGLQAKQSMMDASSGSKSKDLKSFKEQIKTTIQKPSSNPPSTKKEKPPRRAKQQRPKVSRIQQIKERYIQRNNENKAENEYTKQQIKYYNDYRTRPPHQHGINDFIFDSCGLKLIVINDRDSNFLPIASFNSTPFKSEWAYNEKQNSIQTSLWLSINFFNVIIGRWEPFLEKFNFYANVNQDREFQKESMQLQINSPLNVNLTEKLVENVYESHKSWAIVYEDYQTYEKIMDKREAEGGGLGDLDFFNIFGGDPNQAEGAKLAPQLSLLDQRLAEAIELQKKKSAEQL